MTSNGSSSNRDEIVLTQSGDIFNPVEIDTVLTVANFSCCLVGIPLNVSVAVAIIRHRRLHRKPRNIFLLGIILSNLSFFIPAVIKLIYWGFYSSSEWLCQSYVALVGVPQGLLSLNMLLALADRYVAINHPLLHREKMTVRLLASAIVLLGSTSVVFLLKFIYIFDLAPLRCEVGLIHVKIVLVVLTVTFASSVALNVIVYRQTKNYLSESQCYAPTSTNDDVGQIQSVIFDVSVQQRAAAAGNDGAVPASSGDYPIPMTPMSIHVNREKLCQMEVEATRTLIIGVTSLAVTALPPTVFVSVYLLTCRLVSQSDCSQMNWLAPYMIELGLVNIVCSPLIFLVRNKELKTALTCQ